jgi:hypothetical protein
MAATNVPQQLSNHSAAIRKIVASLQDTRNQLAMTQAQLADAASRPRTITEEIDSIPGRRIESIFSGEIEFDITDLSQRGQPIIIQISQDGDFIMTHYPMALWYPTAPSNTQNLGRWRPVSSFPLPTQEVSGDIIDILYELDDAGSQRFMQNNPRGPVLSRPDNIVPCPVPTQWAPNASIKFTPTYNAISFTGSGEEPVPPTSGVLHVDLLGYRIVNL